jgi:hypothetical protein
MRLYKGGTGMVKIETLGIGTGLVQRFRGWRKRMKRK